MDDNHKFAILFTAKEWLLLAVATATLSESDEKYRALSEHIVDAYFNEAKKIKERAGNA